MFQLTTLKCSCLTDLDRLCDLKNLVCAFILLHLLWYICLFQPALKSFYRLVGVSPSTHIQSYLLRYSFILQSTLPQVEDCLVLIVWGVSPRGSLKRCSVPHRCTNSPTSPTIQCNSLSQCLNCWKTPTA